MPRHGRFLLPGVAVHVIQRGNNRNDTFWRTQDREHYLYLLGRFAPRAGCDIHAYCLMTNHVHLLLTPADADSCTRMMKDLGQNYTQYANRVRGRSGSLWEGRFKSCLVDSDAYLLHCHRYVESNPVRAGLVREPGEYRWSSYRHYADGEANPILTPHATYVALGEDGPGRQRGFKTIAGDPPESERIAEIREATSGGFVFGALDFQRRIAAILGRRVMKGTPGRPAKSSSLIGEAQGSPRQRKNVV